MMLLSKACYDPKEAIKFQERLGTIDDVNNVEYFSTHPIAGMYSRISNLEHSMPLAKHLWNDSKCDKVL
ncbi:hypothetical protein BC833DRAFT_602890 [Globomyces pollinis-pini]|nr:hypothetical protein BC833DRAFT_602890 [Globomyces pollinis-pini]